LSAFTASIKRDHAPAAVPVLACQLPGGQSSGREGESNWKVDRAKGAFSES
jgi:hypothetical protein